MRPKGLRETAKLARSRARRSVILTMRAQGATLTVIARRFGISRERVRQIIDEQRSLEPARPEPVTPIEARMLGKRALPW